MKTIAVIEDTGERRLPHGGEVWTLPSSYKQFDPVNGLYSHEPSSGTLECIILRVTAFKDGDEPTLSLKERIELIHLRKFAKQVKEASATLSAHDIDGPEELLKEAEHLATRMQFAGIVLGESLKTFKGRESDEEWLGRKSLAVDYPATPEPINLSPCPADWPTPSELASDAMAVQGVARAAEDLSMSVVSEPGPVAIASPFETEETPF